MPHRLKAGLRTAVLVLMPAVGPGAQIFDSHDVQGIHCYDFTISIQYGYGARPDQHKFRMTYGIFATV